MEKDSSVLKRNLFNYVFKYNTSSTNLSNLHVKSFRMIYHTQTEQKFKLVNVSFKQHSPELLIRLTDFMPKCGYYITFG